MAWSPHRFAKPAFVGSNPTRALEFGKVAEWMIGSGIINHFKRFGNKPFFILSKWFDVSILIAKYNYD